MGVVDEALTAALRVTPQVPRPAKPATIDEAAGFYGKPREQNRAIADQAGVSIREVQRWRQYERGGTGQKRRPPPAAVKRITGTARRRQLAAWRAAQRSIDPTAAARRSGLNVRLRGMLFVYRGSPKYKTAPAPSGSVQRWWPVAPELLGPTLDAWAGGERERAGELLVDAFLSSYLGANAGGTGLEATFDEIDGAWVELR